MQSSNPCVFTDHGTANKARRAPGDRCMSNRPNTQYTLIITYGLHSNMISNQRGYLSNSL